MELKFRTQHRVAGVQEHKLTGLINQKNVKHTVTKIIMSTNLASVQDSTQENPLKRIFPEVLRKSVGVTEINING